jgi:hypothetical protein
MQILVFIAAGLVLSMFVGKRVPRARSVTARMPPARM